MKAVSQTLRDTVRRGHQRTMLVNVYDSTGALTASSDEAYADTQGVEYLPVEDGSVTYDGSRASGFSTASMVVPGLKWAPVDDTSVLTPFGTSVDLSYRFITDAGLEDVHMGRLWIVDVEVSKPRGLITVILADPSYWVERALLETSRQWNANARVLDIILEMAREGWGDPAINVGVNDLGTVQLGGEGFIGNMGDSRWGIAYNLADTHDCDVYFTDPTTIDIVSRTYTAPTWSEVLDTGPDGVVTDTSARITLLGGYNKVVATIEGSAGDAPVFRAERTLTTGPFAYEEPFTGGVGLLPLTIVERIENASQALADDLADYHFKRQVGAVRELDLRAIPMPWLEVGDTVLVGGPDGAEIAVVEALEFPFTADADMTVRTRTRTDTATPFPSPPPGLAPPTFLGANR